MKFVNFALMVASSVQATKLTEGKSEQEGWVYQAKNKDILSDDYFDKTNV